VAVSFRLSDTRYNFSLNLLKFKSKAKKMDEDSEMMAMEGMF